MYLISYTYLILNVCTYFKQITIYIVSYTYTHFKYIATYLHTTYFCGTKTLHQDLVIVKSPIEYTICDRRLYILIVPIPVNIFYICSYCIFNNNYSWPHSYRL